MKDITINVRMARYLREWLVFHFGLPVRFPARSYENGVLTRYLCKPPKGAAPEACYDDSVAIVLPDNDYRRPEFYNHLGRSGRRALISAVDTLFRLAMWNGCLPLLHSRRGINSGVDRWCEENGISLDAREAVRQKFYRMRLAYQKHGVVVGKIYSKKTAKIGA